MRTNRTILLVSLLALVLFLPTVRHGFAYDDAITILENPDVREHRFGQALLSPYHAGPSQKIPTGLYRPLTTWTFAAQHALHGASPRAYHAGNVLLHALVTALVAALAIEAVRGLGRRPEAAGAAALVAGLVFAIHPVHVEAVANVSGRAELLSAAFGLAALLVHARVRDGDGRASLAGSTLAAVLLFLACLAKESAVMLAVVLVFGEALRRRSPRDVARTCAVAALPVLLFLALRVGVLGSLTLRDDAVTFLENPVVGQSLPVRWLTALAVVARGAGLLVLPLRLTPDYGFAHLEPVTFLLEPAAVAGFALVVAAAVALVLLPRKRPEAALGLALLVAPWFLVSNFFVTIGTIFGERLLYLPSAGFALLLGVAAAALSVRARARPFVVAVGAMVLLFWGWRSLTYAETWKDDLTLFTAAERVAPRSVRVLSNLGVELALRGRLAEAEARLVYAHELAPWVVPVRINLAGVYRQQGRHAEAEALE